jgi:cyclophilin family peptidyl-prolyl cis-trans isomerase
MRNLLAVFVTLLATLGQSSAQLYADVQTSAGYFTCELNFQQTPRTVANFVSLAEGTRQWVDERNGQLSRLSPPQPFYNGMPIHRIINAEGFKLMQAGSKRGDGTDGPGYEFPDEMNVNVPATYGFDDPYMLAMANSGPNTNGSQFFVTGSAIKGLEGKHTVFGKVVAGQSVVDAILATTVDANDKPVADVVIEKITIRRIGKAAQQFKAASMKLPTLSAPPFTRETAPSPEHTARFVFSQGQRSELLVYASIDPEQDTWQKLESRWHAPSPYTVRYYDVTYPEDSPVTGFRPILAKYHPDALTPMSLKGWTLSLENAEGVYLFSFPQEGAMGYMFTPAGSKLAQTGTIHAASLLYQAAPHHAIAEFELDQQKIIHLHLGFDKKIKNNLHGRCVSKVKHFVVTNPETDAGFYPGQFTEPGGDKGFSMVPIE